jgi:hypothetical protein
VRSIYSVIEEEEILPTFKDSETGEGRWRADSGPLLLLSFSFDVLPGLDLA